MNICSYLHVSLVIKKTEYFCRSNKCQCPECFSSFTNNISVIYIILKQWHSNKNCNYYFTNNSHKIFFLIAFSFFFLFSETTKVLLLKLFNHIYFLYILDVKNNLSFIHFISLRDKKTLKTQLTNVQHTQWYAR